MVSLQMTFKRREFNKPFSFRLSRLGFKTGISSGAPNEQENAKIANNPAKNTTVVAKTKIKKTATLLRCYSQAFSEQKQ